MTAQPSCPAAFATGIPMVTISMTAGAPTMTYIRSVVRAAGSIPPTFVIACATETFPELRREFDFAAVGSQLTGTAPYSIRFDSRGFLSPVPAGAFPGVARLMLQPKDPAAKSQALVVLASGVSCVEGSTLGQCRGH